MVERHEILRTTLKVMGGGLKQVVHNADDFPVGFTFFDLEKKNPEQREKFISHTKVFQYCMPFNFEYGPLFRIFVLRKNEKQFEVLIFFHHVIFDLDSAKIFRRDATKIWASLIQGNSPVFSNKPVQYNAYSSLENRLLNTAFGDPHKKYWEKQLTQKFQRLLIIDKAKWDSYFDKHIKKIEEVKKKIISLPFYDLRFIASVVLKYREENVGALHYVYNRRTFKNILEFRKNRNSSLLSLLIASLILTLNRLSGQESFVFATFVPRKTDGDYKNTIGWLSTGGICFFDINENRSTSDFLDYIDKQLFLLSTHNMYPFEVLDYRSKVPIGSLIPLWLTTKEIESSPDIDDENSGVVSHIYENSSTYQELSLWLFITGNSCSVKMFYNNFLFSPNVIEQIISEQEVTINSIVRDILPAEIAV